MSALWPVLAALGGAAVAWPLAARAQQSTMPVQQGHGSRRLVGFRQGLNEIGYVEDRIYSQHIVCCITPHDPFIDELDLPLAGWRLEGDRFVARQTVENR